MTPMHAKIKHTSKCPCCRSNFSAGNSGNKKNRQALKQAKGAARQEAKRNLQKDME